MKAISILLGVALIVGVQSNVCEEEGTGFLICCDGWIGSIYDGCPTPVCEESCERYGGTCVEPNICMGCPEDRYGVNCENSQCEQEREDHSALNWWAQRDLLKPSCLPDGSYSLLQCHHRTQICHCVDRWTGLAYVDTYTPGVPDCSEYYVDTSPLFRPKEVRRIVSVEGSSEEVIPEPEPVSKPCEKAHKKWVSSRFLYIFRDEPQCANDGYYVSQRCDYFRGYCVCVNRFTGHDIQYTRVDAGNSIDCSNIPMPEPEPAAPRDGSHSEEGCVRDTKYYERDQSFYDDCNLCVCHGYGVIQCTTRDCTTDSCHLGELNKNVDHIFMGHCHRCVCNHGVYTCTMEHCDQLEDPGEMEEVAFCGNKPPMTNYHDECNTCFCSKSGQAMCTLMACYSDEMGCHVDLLDSSRFYENGQQFTKGCDTYQCVDGELRAIETCADTMIDMVLTKEKPETACQYEGEDFYNGESMLLGYRMCKCENFTWNCQLMVDLEEGHP